jgi:hypothetical protein
MKISFFAILLGALLAGSGCVSTVDEHSTAGVPFVKDKVGGQYERTVDQIAAAARQVITSNGVLVNETTLYKHTNPVKTVEGKINQRSVWVRIESIDPKVSAVTVQTRTAGGGSDLDLAHEVEKQIALKLVQ